MAAVHMTVVGDALLDRDLDGSVDRVAPDAPVPVVDGIETRVRPGGAALTAVLARDSGADVSLVTALGQDAAGDALRSMLDERGVDVVDLGRTGATNEKTRIRADGHPLVRIDRGGDGAIGAMHDDAREAIGGADVVLVADYGAGVVHAARAALAPLRRRPLVWDPHPRGDTPVRAATIVTPNFREACGFAGVSGAERPSVGRAADIGRVLRDTWQVGAVAVTMGELGAVLSDGSMLPLAVPSVQTERGDPCGAGDCFAANLAHALAQRALPSEAVAAAVRAAGAYVARHDPATASEGDTGAPIRARVVATSGCFDLLHAGHVQMLHAARRLGDRLVVLLNSDASVRRLKGPRRPIVPEHDRAALLRALACVDDVVIFDEDTPVQALERVQPDVFVKGGDYGARAIPESRVLSAWGGRAVVVPYLQGRSTTALAKEAMNAQRS
jgi:D-beta-D-heptose 7-phosphate kinase/D-beta-D-heptose 1-phosphate adenosyltransferase